MYLGDCAGPRADCAQVILEVSAIRGSYFEEIRATPPHAVRTGEAATDFDKLAAGNDHFTPARECAECNNQSRCAVVHDDCVFRTSQLPEQRYAMRVASAA